MADEFLEFAHESSPQTPKRKWFEQWPWKRPESIPERVESRLLRVESICRAVMAELHTISERTYRDAQRTAQAARAIRKAQGVQGPDEQESPSESPVTGVPRSVLIRRGHFARGNGGA